MTRLGATSVAGGTRFEVWAPDASSVDVVLDGSTLPLARDDDAGTWIGTANGIGHGDRYRIRLDGGEELADPASGWQPEGVFGASAVVDASRFAWTDDAWQRRRPRRHRAVRAARRDVHAGRHARRGDRRAAPPRRPRRDDRRADAAQRVPRRPQLGLRRRVLVGRPAHVRRPGGARPVRRRRPRRRPRRRGRCRLQPRRPARIGAPALRPVLRRHRQHAVGRRAQRRRGGQRPRPAHDHRERHPLDRGLPRRRPARRRRPRHPRPHGTPRPRAADARRARGGRGGRANRRSSSPRARTTTRASCARTARAATGSMPSGTTTCTTRSVWRSPAIGARTTASTTVRRTWPRCSPSVGCSVAATRRGAAAPMAGPPAACRSSGSWCSRATTTTSATRLPAPARRTTGHSDSWRPPPCCCRRSRRCCSWARSTPNRHRSRTSSTMATRSC